MTHKNYKPIRKCITAFIAAATCLLAACHTPVPAPEQDADPSDHSPTPPVTYTAPPPAQQTTPPFEPELEPEPPPEEETAPIQQYIVTLPGGPLPEDGYTPDQTPEQYYEHTVNGLVPSDEYGRIWPYIGGYADTMIGTLNDLIGICDENGTIICPPIYSDVKIIEKNGREIYAFINYDIERGGGRGGRNEQLQITTFAALDGSWAETFERAIWEENDSYEYSPPQYDEYGISGRYNWREPISYDYITAKRGGSWGVVDWNGTELLPFKYAEPVCFHEGLASVLSEDKETYSFIDITGNTVLGPYEAPPRAVIEYNYMGMESPITDKILFYESYAKFYSDGKYGTIDNKGSIIIPAEYDFITCMNGGLAMYVEYYENDETMPERYGVVTDSGDVIIDPMEYNYRWFMHPRCLDGQALMSTHNGTTSELVARDGTRTPYESAAPVIHNGENYVFSENGASFSGHQYSIEYINDDTLIIFNHANATWRLYNRRGEPITSENPGRLDYRYLGRYPGYVIVNVTPPDTWIWPPPLMIYNLEGTPLLEEAYSSIIPIGDKIMVRGKTHAGLVDQTGAYIIKVSTTAYAID